MNNINELLAERFPNKEAELAFFNESTYARLGDDLIRLRKMRGLTQGQLAAKIGTTQAVISRLENATVKASLETVVRIAKVLRAVVDIHLVSQEQLAKTKTKDAKRDAGIQLVPQEQQLINKKNIGTRGKYLNFIEMPIQQPAIFTKDMYSRLINLSSVTSNKQSSRWC